MSVVDEFDGIQTFTEEDFEGLDLEFIKCRSCSGYGNCGYKTYCIYDDGDDETVISICNRRKQKFICERDGIPFEED